MLELRPTCEHCNKELPPNSTEAMICSYECTFCSNCAIEIFENICPNCGGGFSNRPSQNLKNDNHLDKHPASMKVIHSPKKYLNIKNLHQKLNQYPHMNDNEP